jgi:pimeloyl-ACP methyl ester carboxylesterase
MVTPALWSRRRLIGTMAALLGSQALRFNEASARPEMSSLIDKDHLNAKLPQPADITLNKRTMRTVRYIRMGSPGAPLILYFHGWGAGYQGCIPLERSLIKAGFNILVPNRPGYAGTGLNNGPSAADAAIMASDLLDKLGISGGVGVIGTSGGAPAALAFASRFAARTKALVIQAGVTHRWDGGEYVPGLLRDVWSAVDLVDDILNALADDDSAKKFALELMTKLPPPDKQMLAEGLFGDRLADLQTRAGYQAYLDFAANECGNKEDDGKVNDLINVFMSPMPYFQAARIDGSKTLIIHDPKDQFVPFVHASNVLNQIKGAELAPLALGGHCIWLGRDAARMQQKRVSFLKERLA